MWRETSEAARSWESAEELQTNSLLKGPFSQSGNDRSILAVQSGSRAGSGLLLKSVSLVFVCAIVVDSNAVNTARMDTVAGMITKLLELLITFSPDSNAQFKLSPRTGKIAERQYLFSPQTPDCMHQGHFPAKPQMEV